MEKLLGILKAHDAFTDEDQKVGGIAQRAIDYGFDTLSEAQKDVLEPFLEMECSGSTDPGGYHNGCEKMISGDDLVEAIELSEDGLEGIQCEDCRADDSYYQHQWERIEKE